MKLSSSMSFFFVLFYFLIRGSAQYCPGAYVKVLHEWGCISKKQCLERGFVISNGYCRRTCPGALYLSYDARTCHRSCPDDTVVNGSNCLNSTQCTARGMFVYNGSCVDSCPLGTVVTMSDICVHNCPYQTVTNTTHCINPHDCTEARKVISNSTCTDQCPPGFPYVDAGRCASDCRDGKVSYNHQCITQHRCIHEEGKVIQNRSCVGSCSPDAPNIYDGQCYSQCPLGTVPNASLSTCLVDSVCTDKGQFILNGTCVAECPRYVSGKACVDECPRETALYHKECITRTKCTHFNYLYMFMFNGTCVESCPVEAPYIDHNRCYAVCPLGKVAEDKHCIVTYQCNLKVIHNNTCLTSCPETAPLSAPGIYGATYCVLACPVNTVAQNVTCISSERCISQGNFVFNGTCVITCPEEAPYHSSGKCHHQCPQGQRATDTECIECDSDKLLDGKACIYKYECHERNKFQYKGKCLLSCPHGTKEDVGLFTNKCQAQPNLLPLLTLLFSALLVITVICLCMTIPRNGAKTRDERIKATLTTKTRKQVYENNGFEEHEDHECCDDTNDVETGAIRTPDNGEACDVEVVGPFENVYFMKETGQIDQSEI
ncbi:proprotein convertase subtilisin/kexin type 5-like isoform X2 [Haliotis rubra]|uniref:proprotein convertase subtilisin/kexin type 5-like isoform X2 n=1 Tax=Haliotis rubra TaxID=36100 RepID=UPI001EE51260|nr:proprotein convertase subtilisin/kexin type 5-like isoform X2 [Haliotis rubra]